jgi:non-canonical purine NTP pyrophosphatase (RdgB/HAM1 family)
LNSSLSEATMPELLFATHNPWKVSLFRPTFQCYGINLLTLNAITADGNPPDERGLTALENALIKAQHYQAAFRSWVFGDDAGLEIDALGGEPGLKARRWNGHFSDDVDDQTWLDYLLFRLRDVPLANRTASFVSGWALVAPDGAAYTREIRWPFQIASKPFRPLSPGSPISAVRIGPGDDLAHRQVEIQQEWERWGILEELLACKPEDK